MKINLKWVGKGINEKAIDKKTKRVIIKISKKYFRPTEVDSLIGSSKKAKKLLNWKPKISLNNLIKEMVDSELKELNK